MLNNNNEKDDNFSPKKNTNCTKREWKPKLDELSFFLLLLLFLEKTTDEIESFACLNQYFTTMRTKEEREE